MPIKVLEAEHGKFETFKHIVAEDCPECGCNRAIRSGQRLPGIHRVECAACGFEH